jgi:hypothetical protein
MCLVVISLSLSQSLSLLLTAGRRQFARSASGWRRNGAPRRGAQDHGAVADVDAVTHHVLRLKYDHGAFATMKCRWAFCDCGFMIVHCDIGKGYKDYEHVCRSLGGVVPNDQLEGEQSAMVRSHVGYEQRGTGDRALDA